MLTKSYDSKTIIVNLWGNDKSEITPTIDNDCKHEFHHNQHCKSCGSFVGYWGEESNPYKFYEHTIQFLVNNPNSDIFIISKRIIPFEIVGDNFGLYSIIHNRHLVVINNGTHYINVFLKTKKLDKKVLFTKSYMNFIMKYMDNETIFINPTKKDLGFPIKYEVKNTEIKQ